MKNIALIDGNSVGHAANAAPKLTVGDKPTQAIIGTLKTIRNTIHRFSNYNPVVLWDGKAHFRYELFPGYKDRSGKNEQTDELRAMYKEQVPEIETALTLLGVKQVRNTMLEADDLAYFYTSKVTAKGGRVQLVTGDKDWLQMLDEPVRWFDHRYETMITFDKLMDETGYMTTQQFIQGKALQGDTSDTIPGVGGIGKTGAPKLLAEYGSVEELIALGKCGKIKLTKALDNLINNHVPPPKKSRKTGEITELAPVQDAFYRNMKLMDLSQAPAPKSEHQQVTVAKMDEDAFIDFCQENLFNSIIADYDNWIKPFRAAYN